MKSIKNIIAITLAAASCLTIGIPASCSKPVTAIAADAKISNVTVEKNVLTVGESTKLTIEWEYGSDTDIFFYSRDESIVKITDTSENGCTLTALKVGKTEINVSNGDFFKMIIIEVVPREIIETPVEIIKGDVNGDGEFNIADIVKFQRWLLGKDSYMKYGEAADFCEDGMLDVYDLCLMKASLLEIGIDKINMTRDEFFEILYTKDEYTWSDFEQFRSEDIGTDEHILRYQINISEDSSSRFYLFVTGKSMDEKPESITIGTSNKPDPENDEDIYEFREEFLLFINSFKQPDNSEKDRENAQVIADRAFSDFENGTLAIGDTEIIDLKHELKDMRIESGLYSYRLINEHTVMIRFDRGGFFDVYGYLVTDGAVEYELGLIEGIDKNFDGGADIMERYDNIYYFYAST